MQESSSGEFIYTAIGKFIRVDGIGVVSDYSKAKQSNIVDGITR